MDTFIVESSGFGHVSVDTFRAESSTEAERKARKKHNIRVRAMPKERALHDLEDLDFTPTLDRLWFNCEGEVQ